MPLPHQQVSEQFADDREFARLRSRRRRKHADDDIDITPMIDIVFLLLIFFIVASKIDPGASVSLPKARFGVPVAGTKAVVLVVVPGGSVGSVRVLKEDGAEIASGDNTEQLQAAVAQYALDGLMGKSEGGPKETVLIKAERGLKQREVDKVLQAMGRVKQEFVALESVYIAVLESK
jgi:biopolymer transport protein ExbD